MAVRHSSAEGQTSAAVRSKESPGLILASGSPRRADLLRQIGLPFRVVEPAVDEPLEEATESLADWVTRCAVQKATDVGSRVSGAVILAADTVVALGEHRLGKPRDPADAARMLTLLSGMTHEVVTGLAVLGPDGTCSVAAERTRVTFRPLSPPEIAAYVHTGEPADKAGAYAIQGRAGLFVRRIEGCYSNVVGLPLARAAEMLKHVGIRVHSHW